MFELESIRSIFNSSVDWLSGFALNVLSKNKTRYNKKAVISLKEIFRKHRLNPDLNSDFPIDFDHYFRDARLQAAFRELHMGNYNKKDVNIFFKECSAVTKVYYAHVLRQWNIRLKALPDQEFVELRSKRQINRITKDMARYQYQSAWKAYNHSAL